MKAFYMKVILLVACVGCCEAQNVRSMLESMQQEYTKTSKFHIVMLLQVQTHGATSSLYEEMIDLKKDSTNYLFKYGVIDVLSNERYTLVIDHDTKEISCAPRIFTKQDMSSYFKMTLDSVLTFYKEPDRIDMQNNTVRYRFEQKKTGRLQNVDLIINTTTNLMQAVDYHYRNGQHVKIEFKIFDVKPTFDSSTFDDAKYVRRISDEWLVSSDFNGYRVNENAN